MLDILEVSKLILNACMLRKSSSAPLHFTRSDYREMDPEGDRNFITIRQENGRVIRGDVPLGYYGDAEKEYVKRNEDYIREKEEGSDCRG